MKNFLKLSSITAVILAVVFSVASCNKEEIAPANEKIANEQADVYVKNGVLRFKDFETFKRIAESWNNDEQTIMAFLAEVGFDNSLYIDYLNSGKSELHVVSAMVMSEMHAAVVSTDGFLVVGNTLNYFDGKAEYLFENFTEEMIENIRLKKQDLSIASMHEVKVNSITNLKEGDGSAIDYTYAYLWGTDINGTNKTCEVRIAVRYSYSRWVWTNTVRMKLNLTNYLGDLKTQIVKITGQAYINDYYNRESSPNPTSFYKQTDDNKDDHYVDLLLYSRYSSKGKFCWKYVSATVEIKDNYGKDFSYYIDFHKDYFNSLVVCQY